MKTTREVAKPVELYVNRATGALMPDMAEVRRHVEATEPEHYKQERQVDRRTVDDLERDIRAMEDIVTDRERTIALLSPQLDAASELVKRCKESVANIAIAVAQKVPGTRGGVKESATKLADAEEALASVEHRLDGSMRVLAATKAIQVEWFKLNGKRLSELRKLTNRPRIGDKF